MLGKQSRWFAPLAATAALLLVASPASAVTDAGLSDYSCSVGFVRAALILALTATGGKITGDPLQQRQPLTGWAQESS